jgi:hypothetical protein
MADGGFHLQVPLDASQVPGFKPERQVKVVARDGKGALHSRLVALDQGGRGVAAFSFAENPGDLDLALGPEEMADDRVHGLRTLTARVLAREWASGRELRIQPVLITRFFWHWWWTLCRTFTITGRVLCADGNPAAGALVCAYDVDYWWWWWSRDQVGCGLTDTNGHFQIEFTWCCGFLPWFWWRQRYWRLEPNLVEHILPALQREGKLRAPVPTPRADLSLFAELAAVQPGVARPPVPAAKANPALAARASLSQLEVRSGPAPRIAVEPRASIDPAALSKLHEQLLPLLPAVPALEGLRLWPWWPWEPWFDCTPDILFRVTQGPQGTVILDQGPRHVHRDIPTRLDVTLRANDKALCLARPAPRPAGSCVVLSNVCGSDVERIGGNVELGAPPALPAQAGYLLPGVGDNPFGENVVLSGMFGDTAGVDYYEFEWQSVTGGVAMQAMPDGTVGGFTRRFYGPGLTPGDLGPWHYVSFPVLTKNGRRVIESREHFERTHAPATWGEGNARQWAEDNYDDLIVWLTGGGNFPDDTYRLRLVGWRDDGAGNLDLSSYTVLPLCSGLDASLPSSTPNQLVLTLDNRVVVAGSGSTSNPTQPCGDGTIHVCTQEPNTGFLGIVIKHQDNSTTPVTACGRFPIVDTDLLQIDFVVEDLDGHLGHFTLDATYDVDRVRRLVCPAGIDSCPGTDLLHSVAGATLTPAGSGLSIGPTRYSEALAQGVATSPHWYGGTYRLTIPARQAFPETCCYQLELRAYKRTVVSCSGAHENFSTSSFMIEVPALLLPAVTVS